LLQKPLHSFSITATHFKNVCFARQTKVYLNSQFEIDMETAKGSVFYSGEGFLPNHSPIYPCVYRRDFECRGKLQYIAKLQSEWSDGRVTAAWNVLPPELTSAGHSCLVSPRLTHDAGMERNGGDRRRERGHQMVGFEREKEET
jgi:hypothetical protein